jgi:hypothetical protein
MSSLLAVNDPLTLQNMASNKDIVVQIYRSAPDFLDACASVLMATRTVSANLPLSSAFALRDGAIPPSPSDLWLAARMKSDDALNGEATIVLTLVNVFPGVLASSTDPALLSPTIVADAMAEIVRTLDSEAVAVDRVYSVAGPAALSNAFAGAWEAAHGVQRRPDPLMHMYLSYVTRETLRPPTRAPPPGTEVGSLGLEDLEVAAKMNQRFGETTPHRLDDAAALEQTRGLIGRGEMFGVRVAGALRAIAIAKISMPGVRSVGKVWTDEDVRGRGLAEVVVREACKGQVFAAIARMWADWHIQQGARRRSTVRDPVRRREQPGCGPPVRSPRVFGFELGRSRGRMRRMA